MGDNSQKSGKAETASTRKEDVLRGIQRSGKRVRKAMEVLKELAASDKQLDAALRQAKVPELLTQRIANLKKMAQDEIAKSFDF